MYNQRQAKGVSSAEYMLQRGTASENGVFPCLFPRSGKAVSKLYREKIDQLQAAEQRLLEQKAEAQRAARRWPSRPAGTATVWCVRHRTP